MARLKCICGNSLSNSTDYDTDIYYIYSKAEIVKAIQKNSKLLYWNFYTDREPQYDFWYCSRCKRMMVCSKEKNRVESIFKPIRLTEENKATDTSSWREFYSFSDNELLALTDKNDEQGYKITLREFYESFPRKYFYRISPDETKVFAYESSSGRFAFVYGKEDWTPVDSETK